MSEQLNQSGRSVDVRPSPALRFVKGSTKVTESKEDSNRDDAGIELQESVSISEKTKRQSRKPRSAKSVSRKDENGDKLTQVGEAFSTDEKQNDNLTASKSVSSNATGTEHMRHVYEPFSTRVRQDLKRRLKRLSHHREDCGHQRFKVQHLVEEAIVYWLELQDEPATNT